MKFRGKRFKHDKRQLTAKEKYIRGVGAFIALVMMGVGGYMLFLPYSPEVSFVPSSIDLNLEDDEEDDRNRLQIKQINLEVPFFDGDASVLEKGAWHRFPDRGNPKDGGNFIVSAHRFYIGLTPAGTRERSPFYNLEELDTGSTLRVFYEGEWYDYEVTKKYSVEPTDIHIEDRTEEPRMTIYTCTLGGAADGRVVLEAVLR